MAGHSKWANIKHRKARQDAVKGKAWSKCARAIIIAAKNGGGDPAANLSLRYAIDEAKAVNMPKDTIEKAIKKGTGELESERMEEVRYEGYGPGGVAIIVDVVTDNVQRTGPEMRLYFEKNGGNLGKSGSVAFGFQSKGLILIESGKVTEEQLMEVALEAGADDIRQSDGGWEVTCEPGEFHPVRAALEEANIELASAELTMIPLNLVKVDADTAGKVLKLLDILEEHDDVQKVYSNADIPEEVMANL